MTNNSKKREECTVMIGSVTQAMHAQKILERALVRTEVVKVESSVGGRGCAYALLYPCIMEDSLVRVLQESSIRFRKGGR